MQVLTDGYKNFPLKPKTEKEDLCVHSLIKNLPAELHQGMFALIANEHTNLKDFSSLTMKLQ